MSQQPGPTAHGVRSAALGGDNRGIISTGDHAVNVLLPSGALCAVAEVAAPPWVSNVPVQPPSFVGRAEELEILHDRLSEASGLVVIQAIHGLGGVGKSWLAAHYCRAEAERFNPIWWITADKPSSLEAGLAALAVALQPELASALPPGALAERATAWLAAHHDWLVILDNATGPAHLEPLLSRIRTGRILITSRLGDGWSRLGAAHLRLDVLTEELALELLTRTAEGTDLTGAAELVRELGCLPLAVSQAAAYMRQARVSSRAYLDLLTAHPAVMYDQAARGADGERTIARIWRITLDHLADVPLTGLILRVLAWWAPEAIPRDLLDGFGSSPQVASALGALAAYDMIRLDEETITVHRLVQAVARTLDPGDPHRQGPSILLAREAATASLRLAFPGDLEDLTKSARAQALLPHATALISHIPDGTETTLTIGLRSDTGAALITQGRPQAAIRHLEVADTLCQRIHDGDHPISLNVRMLLAYAYDAVHEYTHATLLGERTLADCERVLGDDHPDTSMVRNNLANAYTASGRPDLAIPLQERMLAHEVHRSGSNHPRTQKSRNNLAGSYLCAGETTRAIDLHKEVLARQEGITGGEDRLDTLAYRENLASAYSQAEDHARAIPLYERALADRERLQGNDHPDALRTRSKLARAYLCSGDPLKAAAFYNFDYFRSLQALGLDHPDNLTRLNEAIVAYNTAIPLYLHKLADAEQTLGLQHPDTLAACIDLVSACAFGNDRERAVQACEGFRDRAVAALDPDHPTVATVEQLLAFLRRASI